MGPAGVRRERAAHSARLSSAGRMGHVPGGPHGRAAALHPGPGDPSSEHRRDPGPSHSSVATLDVTVILSFLNAGFSEIFPVGGSQTQMSWL